jgi:hypothetical protein
MPSACASEALLTSSVSAAAPTTAVRIGLLLSIGVAKRITGESVPYHVSNGPNRPLAKT